MIVANDCLILRIFQMGDGAIREEVLMDVMNHQQAEREAQRVQANREELVERIARALRADGTAQPLQGLHLYRHSFPLEQVYSVVEPSLCVVAQGSKEFLLGESRYRYDPFHYLLVTVDLPYVGQVLEASKERPFLSLRLDLAPTLVSEVMVETGHTSPRGPAEVRAIAVSLLDEHLLDAMVRVARLLEARRLMLGQDLDAASAAYRVGYHDASHFNREYKTLFGVPPMRDVQRLRDEALQSAGR